MRSPSPSRSRSLSPVTVRSRTPSISPTRVASADSDAAPPDGPSGLSLVPNPNPNRADNIPFPANAIVHKDSNHFELAKTLAGFDWVPILRHVQRARPTATMADMVELARFILLKAAGRDMSGVIFSAAPPMLELWRALREFNREYFELCSAHVGKPAVLGHDPRGKDWVLLREGGGSRRLGGRAP
ncbi:hypothetical protein BDK51DRAFT_29764 [Blyttiomyces helicus]|uniref:Uncharacterized protein n=1 Tax=Blyttiomyces helicus TaxID=388810 RepID=A0A4P9WH50_9FUNG|nr:hypothetical protein BDK51DRAFT_29764 [Blyttiomyces helicus]|eukprot:RKO91692.1 hypothetical protein BDK51DRAFT_29764 [Blyttiomyces helicus]